MTDRTNWTPEQTAMLVAEYPHVSTIKVADRIGMTVKQCYYKAQKLGLRKTPEYLASPDACRMRRGDNVGEAHRFAKGLTPWNKGTSFTAGGRSAETRFKPGRPASEARNYRPIGSLRMSKDGYLERKISDDRTVYPARRWVGVHRLVWVEKHGHVPPGHAIVFRPGMHTTKVDDITIDRLEMVTRKELMRRNSHHTNYPPEVSKLIQLRGAVTRQINKRGRAKP